MAGDDDCSVLAGVPLNPEPADHSTSALAGPARLAYFTPLHEHLQLADRKGTFILTSAGLLLTVLLFFIQSLIVLTTQRPAIQSILVFGALVMLGTLLLSAARWAYLATALPMPPPPMTLSLFNHVSRESREEYLRLMLGLDHETALRAVLDYNYSICRQIAGKYQLVNRALRCMKYAIPLWMALLLVIAVFGK
jgi:hypothetical protein